MNKPSVKAKKTGKPQRRHDLLAHAIGIAITSGRYQPGEILCDEVSSSRSLEISRSAYRETIRTLAAKGLIESKPKVGTKVSARCKWHMLDPDVIAWTFEGEPDVETVMSLFELRDVIEPAAAALAAERRSAAQLLAMIRATDNMRRYTLATAAGQQADLEFHTNLLSASGNRYLISLMDALGAAIINTTIYKQRFRPLRRDPVPDHEVLLEAITDQNPEAARGAMATLIHKARLDTSMPRASTKPKEAAAYCAARM